MERGTIYRFNTKKEGMEDYKYYRVIKAITKENMESDNPETGAKMYLLGNVYVNKPLDKQKQMTRSPNVIQNVEIFLQDFIDLLITEEIKEATDSDKAIILITVPEF
jgi:hypothetical protein